MAAPESEYLELIVDNMRATTRTFAKDMMEYWMEPEGWIASCLATAAGLAFIGETVARFAGSRKFDKRIVRELRRIDLVAASAQKNFSPNSQQVCEIALREYNQFTDVCKEEQVTYQHEYGRPGVAEYRRVAIMAVYPGETDVEVWRFGMIRPLLLRFY